MSMKKTELSWIDKCMSRIKEILRGSNREVEQVSHGTQRIHSPEELRKKEIRRAKARITQTRLNALEKSNF